MQDLFDKIINVSLWSLRNGRYVKLTDIECPESGVKPDITLTLNSVPGQVAYGATVTFANFLVPYDVRAISRMDIVAGYRKGQQTKYTFPVFSSYQSSPNPDGQTTFECLAVGTQYDILDDKKVVLHVQADEEGSPTSMSLGQWIDTFTKYFAGRGLKVDCHLSKTVLDQTYNIPGGMYIAANTYELIDWFSQQLNSIGKEMNPPVSIACNITDDNRIVIIAADSRYNQGPAETKSERVFDLRAVTDAEFTAGVLTISAPWQPGLRPGMLCTTPMTYFRGKYTTNQLGDNDFKSPSNIYWVITQNVTFSTTSENKMELLCIAQEMQTFDPKNVQDMFNSQTSEDKLWEKFAPLPVTGTEVITIGNPPKVNMKKPFWQVPWTSTGVPVTVFKSEVYKSWQDIAQEKWGDRTLTGTWEQVKNKDFPMKSDADHMPEVPGMYLWPAIMFATAMQFISLPMADKSPYYFDTNDPLNLYDGHQVIVPSQPFNTFPMDLFKYITDILDNDDYSVEEEMYWKIAYVYLGGTL